MSHFTVFSFILLYARILQFHLPNWFFLISALIILVSKSSFLFSNTPLFCCFNGIHSNFMAAIFSHLSTCNFSLNVLLLPYNIFFFFKLIVYTHTHTHTHTLISFFHVGGVWWPLVIGLCSKMKSLSRVRLFATSWTVAYQAPPSMGFSRQEYWSGLPFSFSRGSSQHRDQTQVSRIPDRRFNLWATREAPYAQKWDTKKLFGDAVWLDQYCHLTACRNIRCWATLSLEEHTPLPIVILCEYFLWGN